MQFSVSDVIARVESNNRMSAVRFEPAKWAHYMTAPSTPEVALCAHYNACSTDTAKAICSTSYGLFQLMGFNLYAPHGAGGFGYDGDVLTFWDDPKAQLDAFNWFLSSRRIADITAEALDTDASARVRFATAYNGPGQPAVYAQMIVDAIKALRSA